MENQNIEWKSKWEEDWLKWICGFANAQGGRLEIGKDNNGKVIGLANPQKLMEDLPNKIKSILGIIPTITLHLEADLAYIVVEVMPYPNPISYRGRYYLRSGATLQELTGFALDEFIMRKYGRTWDSVPVAYVSAVNLDIIAFREFRKKALARQRLNKEDLDITDEQLLENLKLIADGGYLKRAAIMLFHEDPEKWITGAYVKIGYFKTDDDLVFQDEVHGPLITMPDKVVELIYDKYLKGIISYRGLQRLETYLVSKDSLREAVLNAIVHKNYATGIPIQIRVYDNKVIIFNPGSLPDNWTLQDLMTIHTSMPHNPNVANGFFKSGMTEAWGRGIEKIIKSNIDAGKPRPKFEIIGEGIGFRIIFNSYNDVVKDSVKDGVIFDSNGTQIKILDLMIENPRITIKMLSEKIGINERNIYNNIEKLKHLGVVMRAGADRNGEWLVYKDSSNDVAKDSVKAVVKDSVIFEPNGTQIKILDLMIENPRITIKMLSEKIGINERNIYNNIEK